MSPHLFSATGDLSLLAWGIAPGNSMPRKQALKTRFIQLCTWPALNRAFSADVSGFHDSWGDAPGSILNAATLARKHRHPAALQKSSHHLYFRCFIIRMKRFLISFVVAALVFAMAHGATNFDLAAKATSNLGVDLQRKLATGDENLCISPYSIDRAL